LAQLFLRPIEIHRLCDELDPAKFAGRASALIIAIAPTRKASQAGVSLMITQQQKGRFGGS
jgi:hypothetical protein